jgi:hypothetical protein
MRQRAGCLPQLLWVLIFGVGLLYAVTAVTDPWAFHIGGRRTPLLTWWGSGSLRTKGGIEYPLFVYFHPSSHSSQLHLDGVRPTGGVQGTGCLCTSRDTTQPLELSGTIYGGWRRTEGSLMEFGLVESQIFVGQGRGSIYLVGRWQGPELVMDDRGNPGTPFRSGLRIEHASVSLIPSSFWMTCKSACASATNYPPHR